MKLERHTNVVILVLMISSVLNSSLRHGIEKTKVLINLGSPIVTVGDSYDVTEKREMRMIRREHVYERHIHTYIHT